LPEAERRLDALIADAEAGGSAFVAVTGPAHRGNVAFEQGQFGVAISPANMTAILADIRTHIGDNPGLG
jgi:hypothetical protein